MNLLTYLNLNKNELQNAVLHPLATAPDSGKLGQIYYSTADKKVYAYDGSAWKAVGVIYSQTNSTSAVITGLDASGNVTTTNVADLQVSDTKKISDVASDAAKGITDAATAQAAADAAQADVDTLETTVQGLSSAVAGGLKFASDTTLPDFSTMTDEAWSAITNGTIYLIDKTDGTSPNLKTEYLYIKGDTKATSRFELIGDVQADLSGYVKTVDLESKLSGLDVSGSTVIVAAPTEENPSATKEETISDIVKELQNDIEIAQSAAEAAQSTIDGKVATDFIKTATATIAIGSTSATASFTIPTGKQAVVMNVIEKDSDNNIVVTDAQITESGVVFNIAEAYTKAIECSVFYYLI